MKCIRFFILLVFLIEIYQKGNAQSALPDFSVKELSQGKIQISWINLYSNCVQLAVQRSSDSINNFRTIFSSQSPELPANGFVDNRLFSQTKTYYRIFYVLKGGAYFFSKSRGVETKLSIPIALLTPKKLPIRQKDLTSIRINKLIVLRLAPNEYKHFKDSIFSKTKDNLKKLNDRMVDWMPSINNNHRKFYYVYKKESLLCEILKGSLTPFLDSIRLTTKDTIIYLTQDHILIKPYMEPPLNYIYIYRNDSLLLELGRAYYNSFKDSIAAKTRDTLLILSNNRVDIHPFQPKYFWQPSKYVYTNTKGYVTIRIPLAEEQHYRLIFYEENGSELFKIKSITETELLLDKTVFIHAGWFYFELFENEKLKEKNKFFLAKE